MRCFPRRATALPVVLAFASTAPAFAQQSQPTPSAPSTSGSDGIAPAPEAASASGDIVVTATRRSESISRVPIAVSAVTAASLQNAGGSDIRGLVQVVPSLQVTSSASETSVAARVRGIGTAGDNPGLESSVATFIDGVYRNRAGVGLTELGAIDRIEVLRGPQGTLFGRNASAGLINIVTARPQTTWGGDLALTYGSFDERRIEGGVTGPIDAARTLSFRLDGVYTKRDGFLRDVVSGRRLNDRNRYLLRGKILYEPNDDLSLLLIGDFTHRNEECCGASFVRSADVSRGSDGALIFGPSSVAGLERALGGIIIDDPRRREVAITPGRDYRSDVQDAGVSAELNWRIGGAKLTSITAYRDWQSSRGQDADFTNLDLLSRSAYNFHFKTFSQELRLQGTALDDRLDWLIGGYYSHEDLSVADDLSFGSQYGTFQACQIVGAAAPALGVTAAAAIRPSAPGCLNPAVAAGAPSVLGPLAAPLLAGLTRLGTIANVGINDRLHQRDENFALFTHDIVKLTDRLSVTLGARYTHDRKSLRTNLASTNAACQAQRASLGAISGNAGLPATARALAGNLITLACVSNIDSSLDGRGTDDVSDGEWTGTAVLSYRPSTHLLTYASYSKGYKAGGYNLDRAGINPTLAPAARLTSLRFAPEKVNAFEFGAKLSLPTFRVNAALFYEEFDSFQQNVFNGTSFVVYNIQGCKGPLSPGATNLAALGTCASDREPGVISKGVELEAGLYPARDLAVDAGVTIADTRFRRRVTAADGSSLPNALTLIGGGRLALAPLYTVTAGVTYTPEIGRGLRGLVHVDTRLTSDTNTGADLAAEKDQDSVAIVNLRLGLTSADRRWSLEGWARNVFDVYYTQASATAPTQGSGSRSFVAAGFATNSTQLFTVFPAEPRTYGATVRYRF